MAVRVLGLSALLLLLLALGACASQPRSARRPAPVVAAPRPAPPQKPARGPEPQASQALYAAPEALRDVLSSPWQYVATGPWPGNNRAEACVFRNERVLMVNAYCTRSEVPAARIDVYSPERGRVRIYAEANGPVSTRRRQDYFTFMVESEPPPGPQTPVPELSLDMTYEELYAYEQRRYDAYLPTCYGGEQRSEHKHSCMGRLSPRTSQWAQHHQDFLQSPGAAWYHVVQKTRSLAEMYGSEMQ